MMLKSLTIGALAACALALAACEGTGQRLENLRSTSYDWLAGALIEYCDTTQDTLTRAALLARINRELEARDAPTLGEGICGE